MLRTINMIFFILLYLCSNSYSQNTDKAKAVISDLPSTMIAGETYKVTCTITNTGKNEWSSEHLHGKAIGKFNITKEWSGEWKLQPGESTQVYYKITAPSTAGNYKLKVVIYFDNKKIAARTRKIAVVDSTIPPK